MPFGIEISQSDLDLILTRNDPKNEEYLPYYQFKIEERDDLIIYKIKPKFALLSSEFHKF